MEDEGAAVEAEVNEYSDLLSLSAVSAPKHYIGLGRLKPSVQNKWEWL